MIRTIVQHHARDANEADDLYQEAWLNVTRARRRYGGRGPVENWLAAIARRSCNKFYRDHARQRKKLERFGSFIQGAGSTQPGESPTYCVMPAGNESDMDTVYDAVLALPEQQRTLLLMRAYCGLSAAELAARFGKAEGTVKAALCSARRSVRRKLHLKMLDKGDLLR